MEKNKEILTLKKIRLKLIKFYVKACTIKFGLLVPIQNFQRNALMKYYQNLKWKLVESNLQFVFQSVKIFLHDFFLSSILLSSVRQSSSYV